MDQKTLKILEYDRVLVRLADQASSDLGRERALALVPCTDRKQIQLALDETAEAQEILAGGARPPLSGVSDVRAAVRRAGLGGVLDGPELLAVATTAATLGSLQGFLLEREAVSPLLAGLAAPFSFPQAVISAIRAAITDDGEVADGASQVLSRIRRSQRILQERVRDRMQAYLHSADHSRSLQEPIITVREGRYVLPVRQDSRSDFPGVVHDVSSSGATVFVEPMACVPLNNELRRLRGAEEEEVRRILADLSQRLGTESESLLAGLEIFAHLDFVFAKARMALEQRSVKPVLVDEPRLDYPNARHPLLPAAAVVPVSIPLGRGFHVLVITGPNTGGKTVTLKTLGLLSAMLQSGLFIPAGPDAVATVFEDILADIGDEQSIAQNLSTFSSHMGNIVRILERAGERTLVLLDEIGAGTDPTEGTALAVALLEEFTDRGCRTVVTTHYGRLKAFAHTHPGVANASVAFDPETLAPTFRLNVGIPGASNALVIAGRLGLDARLVERARELTGEEQVRLEEVIQGLVRERADLAGERDEAKRAAQDAAALRARYEGLLRDQQQDWKEALARLRSQYRDATARARAEYESAVRELRRFAADGDRRELERGITGIRQRLKEARVEGDPVPEDGPALPLGESPVDPAEILPGLRVLLPRLGQTGYVLAPPDSAGQVPVQVGIIRVLAAAADLLPAEEDRTAGRGPDGGQPAAAASVASGLPLSGQKASSVSPQIDLRGETAADALQRLEKYLDDALLAGLRQVRIIHGKGTGALRDAVLAFLRECAGVSAFSLAPPNEGGEGATVAELR